MKKLNVVAQQWVHVNLLMFQNLRKSLEPGMIWGSSGDSSDDSSDDLNQMYRKTAGVL